MKNKPAFRFLFLSAFVFLQFSSVAQPPDISYQSIVSGFSSPVDVINAGDGSNRLFIVEQGGMIKVWDGASVTNFMNLGVGGANIITSGGERGLLSMAFHPNFNGTTNRYFFVYYTDLIGDVTISRYQTMAGNSNVGDPSTAQVILVVSHHVNDNHNGGKLNFGPDGNLYFAIGDGGAGGDPPNNAQNGNELLGKMIRINVDDFLTPPFYTVPADNPYVSDPTVDDRIYALGLRNPFRWSFDRENGNMWIGDVGQGDYEEIDFRTPVNAAAGTNYGWRCYEGPQPFNPTGCGPIGNYTFPVFYYINTAASQAAVTGGYVYRGNEYTRFRGYYITSDVYTGDVYLVWPNGSGGWNSDVQPAVQTFIVGYGEAEDGTLYAVSLNGNLYKVVATGGGTPLPVVLTSFTVRHSEGMNQLNWSTASEQGTSKFIIEFSFDGRSFTAAGELNALRNSAGNQYTFRHFINTSATLFYRLKMEDDNGSIRYSTILKVPGKNESAVLVYPTLVSDGIINLSAMGGRATVSLVDPSGVVLFAKQLDNISGATSIHLPSLPKGIYIVRVQTGNDFINKKIFIR